MTDNVSLLDQLNQQIESGNLALPVFNVASAKLMALSNSELDAKEVEHLILSDQVLTAEVLRAANSSLFGGLSQINTIRNAIIRLGLMQVSHLAILTANRSQYDAKDPSLCGMIERLWTHASTTATAASWLARRLGFDREQECRSFLGGLLHDVGKLIILRALDEIKKAGTSPSALSPRLVDEIMTAAHPVLGYSFLQKCGIPDVFCEIARDHHAKDFDSRRIPLVTVRLADAAAAKMGASLQPNPSMDLSSLPEAQCLNTNDILLAELEIMIEDSLLQPTV